MRENLEVVILGNVDACRCIVLYPGKNIRFHSLIKMVKRNFSLYVINFLHNGYQIVAMLGRD